MKNTNIKFLLIILISLLVIIGVFSSILIFPKNKKTTVIDKKIDRVSVDETLVKNYSDNINNFSIDYPKTWKVETNFKKDADYVLKLSSPSWPDGTEPTSEIIEDSNGEIITVKFYYDYKYFMASGKNIEEYLSNKEFFTSFEKIKLSSKTDAYKVIQKINSVELSSYYLVKDDGVFIINSNFESSKLGLKTINSFKFL